jgi:hypothetical protein
MRHFNRQSCFEKCKLKMEQSNIAHAHRLPKDDLLGVQGYPRRVMGKVRRL